MALFNYGQPKSNLIWDDEEPQQSNLVWDDEPEPTQPAQPQERGTLGRAWDMISEPLWTGPRQFAEYITRESPEQFAQEQRLYQGMNDTIPGLGTVAASLSGARKGITQGAGEVLTQLTSPIDLADILLFKGAGSAARRGFTGTARALHNAGRLTGVPVAAHGASQVFGEDKTLGERAFGLAEMAGGSAAGLSRFDPAAYAPKPEPKPKPRVKLVMEGVYKNLDDGKFYDDTGVELIPAGKEPPSVFGDDIRDFSEQINPTQDVLAPVVKKNKKVDPNLNQGMGDPELAGSTPYQAKPEPRVTENAIKVKNPDMATTRALNKEGYVAIHKAEDGTTIFDLKPLKEETVNPERPKKYDPDLDPQMARIPGTNKGQISVNVKRAAEELTSGYSGSLEGIMAREGLQNAFDAVKDMGDKGDVSIEVGDFVHPDTGNKTQFIEVTDNGKGMSPEELYTVYTNLHESGKTAQKDASGGKGVGKATYMLGGQYFEVTTTKKIGNKTIQSTFKGTPEELMEGFEVTSKEVPNTTPTGTKFRTTLKDDQDKWYAESMTENISRFSRGLTNRLKMNRYGIGFNDMPLQGIENDKLIGEYNIRNNDMSLYIPHDANTGPATSIQVVYLNNGMYQFKKHMYFDDEVPNMPDKLIVDIKPKVEEGSPDYPFPVQRESIKEDMSTELEIHIKNDLINPLKNRKKTDLNILWNGMKTLDQGHREVVFFDPGNRLTPDELKEITTSIDFDRLAGRIDQIIHEILDSTGYPEWSKKVQRVGITFQPDAYGIHIPNPNDPKNSSAILINPFGHFARDPKAAALEMITTSLHEVAHVKGDHKGKYKMLDASDVDDPRVGQYLQTYVREVIQQGGLDLGHDMGFVHRLGEIYGAFGTRRALRAADDIESIISNQSGGYRPEIQRLLQIYEDSRGRPETTTDILSGTGVKQANPRAGKGSIFGPNQADGNGVPGLDKLLTSLQDSIEGPLIDTTKSKKGTLGEFWGLTRKQKIKELANTPRGIQSSWDISFPFRQGIGLMHTAGWRRQWGKALKSLMSEGNYEVAMKQVSNRPNAKSRIVGGELQPSVYKRMGIAFADLKYGAVNKREEQMISSLAELMPGVRRTNRAYATAANIIRADAADALYDKAKAIYHQAIRTGEARRGFFKEKFDTPEKIEALNPDSNEELMRAIGSYVNNASGRGDLGRLEDSAANLAALMFSPRLMASRVQMLNPKNYLRADPFIRKQYLKSAMMVASFWGTMATLGLLAGADVSTDPGSADFGKIRIGNTRFDPGGGFQQFLVFFYRFASGRYTTSSTNEPHRAGEGYGTKTRWDIADDFITNKLAPIPSMGAGFAKASEWLPFDVSDRTVRLFMPIILQDMSELLQDDPSLANLLGIPLAAVGMGVQSYDERGADTKAIPGVSGPEIY